MSGQESERRLAGERERLRSGQALVALAAGRRRERERPPVDLEPGCAYGVVTRQMVEDLVGELREIKGRLNHLFSVIVGAIALDILLRLASGR